MPKLSFIKETYRLTNHTIFLALVLLSGCVSFSAKDKIKADELHREGKYEEAIKFYLKDVAQYENYCTNGSQIAGCFSISLDCSDIAKIYLDHLENPEKSVEYYKKAIDAAVKNSYIPVDYVAKLRQGLTNAQAQMGGANQAEASQMFRAAYYSAAPWATAPEYLKFLNKQIPVPQSEITKVQEFQSIFDKIFKGTFPGSNSCTFPGPGQSTSVYLKHQICGYNAEIQRFNSLLSEIHSRDLRGYDDAITGKINEVTNRVNNHVAILRKVEGDEGLSKTIGLVAGTYAGAYVGAKTGNADLAKNISMLGGNTEENAKDALNK